MVVIILETDSLALTTCLDSNALAARKRYKPPLIIVDFGTATTFDVVNDEGSYCGGAIPPGHKQ